MLNLTQQTEDKLIILYVLNKIKVGISKEQLAYVIISNVQINYFDVQLYIDGLLNDGLIVASNNSQGIAQLAISEDGRSTLHGLQNKIPIIIQEMLDLYILECRNKILKGSEVEANLEQKALDDFIVHLSLKENNMTLMSLSVSCPTREAAVSMCEKWKQNTESLYSGILSLLT